MIFENMIAGEKSSFKLLKYLFWF